ncbi:response regulator [Paenibacillus piri]|nr:response regulator [Paenibacillus piri]
MGLDEKFHVVVVEDEPIILRNIVDKINSTALPFQVTGSAYDGLEALRLIQQTRPHVLITDVQMPRMSGIELVRHVSARYPDTLTAIISGYNQFEYARQAIKYGVKDYLLKPVDKDEIQATLEGFHHILTECRTNRERALIEAAVQGSAGPWDGTDSGLDGETYVMLLIQLGHLPAQRLSEESIAFLTDLWKSAPIHDIIQELNGSGRWHLIDQTMPGGKYLALPRHSAPDPADFAERLLKRLTELSAPLPVNICMMRESFQLRQLFYCALNLRAAMEERLVMGQSSVIVCDELPAAKESADGPPCSLQHQLLNLMELNNRGVFRNEMRRALLGLTRKEITQLRLQQKIIHLIHLAWQQKLLIPEEEIFHLEYELLNRFALSPDFSCMIEHVVSAFEYIAYAEEEMDHDSAGELVERLEHYLRTCYANPSLSLEEISESFHYNASYLTKLFKKYKCTTPLKFVIALRVAEAQRLIECEPELSFKEIGEMVGYTDPNYFSRIFKNKTGLSLSQYEAASCGRRRCHRQDQQAKCKQS